MFRCDPTGLCGWEFSTAWNIATGIRSYHDCAPVDDGNECEICSQPTLECHIGLGNKIQPPMSQVLKRIEACGIIPLTLMASVWQDHAKPHVLRVTFRHGIIMYCTLLIHCEILSFGVSHISCYLNSAQILTLLVLDACHLFGFAVFVPVSC